jgi:hypothetical protein
MVKNSATAVIIASIYLIVYTLLLQLNQLSIIAAFLFFYSPAVLVWLAISILKNEVYKGRELKEEEHWGYQDKPELHSTSLK